MVHKFFLRLHAAVLETTTKWIYNDGPYETFSVISELLMNAFK